MKMQMTEEKTLKSRFSRNTFAFIENLKLNSSLSVIHLFFSVSLMFFCKCYPSFIFSDLWIDES